MLDSTNKLAVVTGASTGIGLELARQCAKNKFDLVVAANEVGIEAAADELRREGVQVESFQADLSTTKGSINSTPSSQAVRLPPYSQRQSCSLPPSMARRGRWRISSRSSR